MAARRENRPITTAQGLQQSFISYVLSCSLFTAACQLYHMLTSFASSCTVGHTVQLLHWLWASCAGCCSIRMGCGPASRGSCRQQEAAAAATSPSPGAAPCGECTSIRSSWGIPQYTIKRCKMMVIFTCFWVAHDPPSTAGWHVAGAPWYTSRCRRHMLQTQGRSQLYVAWLGSESGANITDAGGSGQMPTVARDSAERYQA
jgi:hypothetical protein